MTSPKLNGDYSYMHQGQSHEVKVEPGKDDMCLTQDTEKTEGGGGSPIPLLITVNGTPHPVYAEVLGSGFVQFMLKDKIYRCVVAKEENERLIFLHGDVFRFTKEMKENGLEGEKLNAPTVEETDPVAPLPGKIIKVLVKEGQTVELEEPLVILEAMKMEHKVVSPFKGSVKKVVFGEGDQVKLGDVLVEMEKIEEKD